MYYSKDGATPVAIIPTRIDATTGGWLLSVSTMTAAVWNCDELRVFWEGTGILSGTQTYYPEAEYTSAVAGRIDTPLSTISGYLDTEVAAILAAVDTEVALIKAKTDNLPASPAATGDAMTLATDAVNSTSLAASAVTEIAAGISSSNAVYAVQGIRTRISESEDDFITLVKSDDKSVVLLFEDESHNPALIPSTATAALLDSAGTSVGTATVTTITAAAGYMLLRLQAPSSGNLPTTLRIAFTGGSGAAYKHDIPVRSFS
jgi:hypothetical protein